MALPAHLANVLQAAQAVGHAARTKKQKGLEEGVRHQMNNASAVFTCTAREEEVSKLAYSGVSEDLLHIGLNQSNRCRNDRRECANNSHHEQRAGSTVVDGG